MVAQIKVTVNGGSTSAVAYASTYPGGSVKFDHLIPGTRVESRIHRHMKDTQEVPFVIPDELITPTDIVEKRAVAALLMSMRAVPSDEEGTRLDGTVPASRKAR
jgi:hypothetical protein